MSLSLAYINLSLVHRPSDVPFRKHVAFPPTCPSRGHQFREDRTRPPRCSNSAYAIIRAPCRTSPACLRAADSISRQSFACRWPPAPQAACCSWSQTGLALSKWSASSRSCTTCLPSSIAGISRVNSLHASKSPVKARMSPSPAASPFPASSNTPALPSGSSRTSPARG
jgi:hypothetical protein